MTPPRGSSGLKPERVRRLAFFRDFTLEEMRHLITAGVVQTYGDGDFLATEGTRKQRRVLYVVLRGELHYVKRVRADCAVVVMRLRPGDVGGFLTFLNESPSPVSVRSVGRSAVFELGRRELHALGADHASLVVKLLRVAMGDTAGRLKAILDRVAATSAWALDLERDLRAIPLLANGPDGE